MTTRPYKLAGLRIDIETRSGADLRKTGVHRYVEDPAFQVLIIGYSIIREYHGGNRRESKATTLDLTDTARVRKFNSLLQDPTIEKHAYNAQFERICLSRFVGLPPQTYLDPKNWHCSAIKANVNGVYGSLDSVAKTLGSPIKKDPVGKNLIRFFSIRDRKTGVFNEMSDHPEKAKQFESYCVRDVETEFMVAHLLEDTGEDVQREYEEDQRISDTGILHNEALSTAAVAAVTAEKQKIETQLKALTGLDNPNSTKQLSEWIAGKGYPMASLNKESRAAALADPMIPDEVAEALTLKGKASLSSVSKHNAAIATRCDDGRIRGSLQFYGAHTGREAGRGIQPQNLPRAQASDEDMAKMVSGNIGDRAFDVAKGSVRASLIPKPGHKFVVCDYSAIEARALAWLAGEEWVLEECRGAGKIYEATASEMFNANKADLVEALKNCGKCGVCTACGLRDKGKTSNLACGYAGGAGALVAMGAEYVGIDIGNYKELKAMWEQAGSPGKFHEWEPDLHDYPELIRLRDLYREASPKTVAFWRNCTSAWDAATGEFRTVQFGPQGRVTMMRDGQHTRMVLPSGRSIWYRKAFNRVDSKNEQRVGQRLYLGKSGSAHTSYQETHGGKLTENVTQAVARDVLFDLIRRITMLKNKGKLSGEIVLHVHDEVVLEVPEDDAKETLRKVLILMKIPPKWAPGLPLAGEGTIMNYYGK